MEIKSYIFSLTFLWVVTGVACTTNDNNSSVFQGQEPVAVIMPLSKAFAKTSINAPIFRCNPIVSDGIIQIASYYDGDGFITFAHRSLNSDKWEIVKTDIQQDCSDAHKSISIALDGDGNIHLAYGMHDSRMTYRRSTSPYSFNFGPLEYMVDSIQEQKVTYPEFYSKNDGNLVFAYRTGYSGNGNLVLNEYKIKTRSWHRILSDVIDGENQRNAYWQMYMDNSDAIHLSWVWRESGDVATNHDLCYAYSADCVNWYTSQRSKYAIPITLSTGEVIKSIPQNSELINQTSLTTDITGHPYIATYWRDSTSTVPQYRMVWNNGQEWNISTIGQRETPFSLSGGGTKRIPIARPKLVVDSHNRAFYLFRDIERGEVVSLAYCQDVNNPIWKVLDLTDFSVEAWEPSIDTERWKRENVLDIYVQKAFQGDGEKAVNERAQMAYIIEVKWK